MNDIDRSFPPQNKAELLLAHEALNVDLFKISTRMDTQDLSPKGWLLFCTKLQKALSKNITQKEWTTHKVQ